MKIPLLSLFLVAVPLLVHAHPGKTDAYGGHQCLKDCAEWDLYYREYHLHDKEGRPVRVARKKERATKPAPATPEPSPTPEKPPEPQIMHSQVLSVVPPEADREIIPLNWALLLLLFLVLLLLRLRSRKGDGRS